MSIGQRIRELRIEAGMTQQELAEKIRISKPNISKYENDQIEPNAALLASIADLFHTTSDYLLCISDERNKPSAAAPKADDGLSEKDEKDISRTLSETLSRLEEAQDGLMFDGAPLDDETRRLLEISLRNSMEIAKKLAREKYTPKKYKDNE